MTLVRTTRGFWAYGLDWDALSVSTPPSLDGSTLEGFVFQVPYSGTLEGWEFMAATGTPSGTLRASLQDVAATGLPDTVEDQFRDFSAAEITPDAWCTVAKPLTHDGSAGGNRRVVTRGEWLAACLDRTGSWGGMRGYSTGVWMDRTAYAAVGYGAWAKGPAGTPKPNLVLVYSDGTRVIPLLCHAVSAINTLTFHVNSATDEYGVLFNLPWSVECDGAAVHVETLGAFDICLYQGTTLQRSNSFDPDVWNHADVRTIVPASWERLSLTANTTYRLTVKPTSTTTVTIYEEQYASTTIAAAAGGGSASGFTTSRVDAGAFADQTVKKLIGFMLHLSGIDTP